MTVSDVELATLATTHDIINLGMLADGERRRRHGLRTTFVRVARVSPLQCMCLRNGRSRRRGRITILARKELERLAGVHTERRKSSFGDCSAKHEPGWPPHALTPLPSLPLPTLGRAASTSSVARLKDVLPKGGLGKEHVCIRTMGQPIG